MSEISESTPSITVGSNSSKLPTSNSHSHSVQITTIRLNENNFLRWSKFVRMYIRGRGKIGYLTGDTKEPVRTNPSYATWNAENSMIMAWLVNSMEEEISSNYVLSYCQSSLGQHYSDVFRPWKSISNLWVTTQTGRYLSRWEFGYQIF